MYLRVDDSEAKEEYVDIPLSLRMPCDEALPQVITVEDEHVMKALPQVITIEDEDVMKALFLR